jgi:NAD(P)-dependent dehydrogenase (short-subunit alcohol dehydrogenase family)
MSYSSNAPLKDRVAIVTGGSGGIGRETSKALLENGATVVMSGRNREQGEKVARELGLEFFPADVTRSEEIRQLAQHVQRRFGRIDIAFNNAAIARCVPSEECTDETWHSVIDTNLSGVFYCCRQFGKVMLAQGRGSIINMASMSGLISNVPQVPVRL